MLTQRIFQIASGYEDGNDSHSLRHDPMFLLGAGRKPFDPEEAFASGATISRLEHAATHSDVYRTSEAMVEPGKRHPMAENAMILNGALKLIRQRFPDAPILVRGDGHFSNPALMQARALYVDHQAFGESAPVRLHEEFEYAAGS